MGRQRAALGATLGFALVGCSAPADAVPMPDETQSAALAAQLALASDQQSVCYGWRLDGDQRSSAGSNLGPGIDVQQDPGRCPRWVQLTVSVSYATTGDGSADIAVTSTAGLPGGSNALAGLSRFGVDEAAFVADPVWALVKGASSLPLLAVETGTVDPALAPPDPAPTDAPAAMPDAGGDLWRDRAGYLVGAAILLAVAAAFNGLGRWRRRRDARAG
ncbi:hypothetical protein [Pilimelia columellifera]|uniref:Uncharacterized protein n=1 Tax=Pilimelia columellifera subsp. columellifera TaxID=706583 RepID=A0ABN3MYI9_9ACTN